MNPLSYGGPVCLLFISLYLFLSAFLVKFSVLVSVFVFSVNCFSILCISCPAPVFYIFLSFFLCLLYLFLSRFLFLRFSFSPSPFLFLFVNIFEVNKFRCLKIDELHEQHREAETKSKTKTPSEIGLNCNIIISKS